jgi:hypothetical protein
MKCLLNSLSLFCNLLPLSLKWLSLVLCMYYFLSEVSLYVFKFAFWKGGKHMIKYINTVKGSVFMRCCHACGVQRGALGMQIPWPSVHCLCSPRPPDHCSTAASAGPDFPSWLPRTQRWQVGFPSVRAKSDRILKSKLINMAASMHVGNTIQKRECAEKLYLSLESL